MTANEEKLWVKQLSMKYCSRLGFFKAEKGPRDSPIWKDILSCKESIEKDLCFLVSDGKSINIWPGPWVPYMLGFKVGPKDDLGEGPMLVCELIVQETRSWNVDLLN